MLDLTIVGQIQQQCQYRIYRLSDILSDKSKLQSLIEYGYANQLNNLNTIEKTGGKEEEEISSFNKWEEAVALLFSWVEAVPLLQQLYGKAYLAHGPFYTPVPSLL